MEDNGSNYQFLPYLAAPLLCFFGACGSRSLSSAIPTKRSSILKVCNNKSFEMEITWRFLFLVFKTPFLIRFSERIRAMQCYTIAKCHGRANIHSHISWQSCIIIIIIIVLADKSAHHIMVHMIHILNDKPDYWLAKFCETCLKYLQNPWKAHFLLKRRNGEFSFKDFQALQLLRL